MQNIIYKLLIWKKYTQFQDITEIVGREGYNDQRGSVDLTCATE